MGGSEETKQVLVKATIDILPTLIDWALSVGEGEKRPNLNLDDRNEEFEKLSSDLDSTTRNEFLNHFDYDFNDENTQPPNIAPDFPTIFPHTEFVNCVDDKPTRINQYINNTLVRNIPQPWQKTLGNDMVSTFTALLNESGSGFKLMTYQRTIFDPLNPKRDPLQVDAILQYCQSTITDDPNSPKYLFLQYCGVAYFINNPVPPPSLVGNGMDVVRIVVPVGSITVARALASFILRTTPNTSTLFVVVKWDESSVTFSLAQRPKLTKMPKQSMAALIIDAQPIIRALADAGFKDPKMTPGLATEDEMREFGYLSLWPDPDF